MHKEMKQIQNSTYTGNLPSDALGEQAYDGDEGTYEF